MRAGALLEKALAGDRRAVSRLLSYIEDESEQIEGVLDAIYCRAGKAHVIGVTGVPGAGKSTLIARLAAEMRLNNKTIAILAIDPSSALSGGAILGDRVRMSKLSADPGVYIRSMASRGRQGGLARTTLEAVDLLDAAGFDVIIVETVGVGQDEFDIWYAAHTTVVVSVPGLGDAVQSIKAGLLEMADIHVVNKADKPDAERTVHDLTGMLGAVARTHDAAWQVPVVATSAESGLGVADLAARLEAHRSFLNDHGGSTQRAKFPERRVWRAVEEMAVRRVRERMQDGAIAALCEKVANREMSPRDAAGVLVGELKD